MSNATAKTTLVIVFSVGCSSAPAMGEDGSSTDSETGESTDETGEPEPCPEVEPLSPGACVEERALFELGERAWCGAAPGGWLLLCDSVLDQLILARIDADDQLHELAQIDGPSSGGLVRDLENDRTWVLEQPNILHEFDDQGQALATTMLGDPNIDATRGLSIYAGDLLWVYSLSDSIGDIVLERRSPDGELRWSHPGSDFVVDNFSVEYLGDVGGRGGVLTAIAYDVHIDSSTVKLLALEPEDGALLWDQPLVFDDFYGPYFDLGGRDETIVVRSPGANYDIDNPGRIELFAVDAGGNTTWTRYFDVPDSLAAYAAVELLDDELYLRVMGQGGSSPHMGVVRFPSSGEPCYASLDPHHLDGLLGIDALGGGRLALNVIFAPDDYQHSNLLVLGDGVGGCIDEP